MFNMNAVRDASKLPDLTRRLLFVLGALFIFRLGTHIASPGIDPEAMARLFKTGGVFGFLDLLAGGGLRRFSVFALGVAPYINSSIIMQLLVVAVPALEKMQKDSGDGRKKIVQYTRLGTIFFAAVQAIGMTLWFKSLDVFTGSPLDFVNVVVSITTGSVIVMWLGEVMSDHGIGNGTSMLIYAGIAARMPDVVVNSYIQLRSGQLSFLALAAAVVLMVLVIAGCIMLQEGQRRLQVQYAKRMVGNKMYGGQSSFLPLKVNTAGVIPIIFASAFMMIPQGIATVLQKGPLLQATFGNPLSPWYLLYIVLYVTLIVFFSYFYTSVVFNPADIANNMKRNGGFILGVRPGKPTSDYIERIMGRITLGGSVALAVVALLPVLTTIFMGSGTFSLGGTAALIVVGVALDTFHQVEAQLIMRHYDGILKKQNKTGNLLRL